MTRKIPSTMASQHPDHAAKPYWHTEAFISTAHEMRELFLAFSELGIDEYKWDWEGKFVDESVVDRLIQEHFEYFKEHELGREKFLTFRLPNPKVETEFRLGRAFMGILGAAGLAKQVGLHTPPLFEVILPMTESAEEMMAIEEAFAEMASLKHALYNFGNSGLKHIEVIPLFEQVSTIMRSHEILAEYVRLHKERFGTTPASMRPYVARSDPAMNSGLIPTVLAIKVALSHYADFEKQTGITLYPIIGSASLPFRGGLTPDTVEQFATEYAGVRTALIQSAFRYDFPKEKVIEGIQKLDQLLPKGKAERVSPKEEKAIQDLIPHFVVPFQNTIEAIAPSINAIAGFLPKRRERVQHVGLFGYSRGVGAVQLPRAIGFTAALYSLGIPPEIIGTGRGLAKAKRMGTLPTIERFYVGMKNDLERAGRFVCRDIVERLAEKFPAWQMILEDVKGVEEYLGHPLGAKTDDERTHAFHVKTIHSALADEQPYADFLPPAALLRKSLG